MVQMVRLALTCPLWMLALHACMADESKLEYEIGVKFIERGDAKSALQRFSKAIELNPGYVDAYSSRSDAWRILGELDKAIIDCDKAIEIDPKFSGAWINRANAWSEKGEFAKALANLTVATRLAPKDPLVFYNRAVVYDRSRQLKKAIADYTKTIKLDETIEHAFYGRGTCKQDLGDYRKAKADYEATLRINDRFLNGRRRLALLLAACPDAAVRNGADAMRHAKLACDATDWKHGGCLLDWAAALAEAERFDEAVKWQKKVLAAASARKPSIFDVFAARVRVELSEEERREQEERLKLYEDKKPYRLATPKDKNR